MKYNYKPRQERKVRANNITGKRQEYLKSFPVFTYCNGEKATKTQCILGKGVQNNHLM